MKKYFTIILLLVALLIPLQVSASPINDSSLIKIVDTDEFDNTPGNDYDNNNFDNDIDDFDNNTNDFNNDFTNNNDNDMLDEDNNFMGYAISGIVGFALGGLIFYFVKRK